MRKLTVALSLCLVVSACSTSEKNEEQQPKAPVAESESPNTSISQHKLETAEQIEGENREKQKRKGELDLDHIENVNVKGDLLESVMSLLHAVKNKDKDARLNLTYDPSFDEFSAAEPYILAVTKIEQDNSRVKAVTDEYDLKQAAEEVTIVKISTKTLDRSLKETVGTGDYIFVKVDGLWKVYRFQ